MAPTDAVPTCASCSKTSPAEEGKRMLVCFRCQEKGKRQVWYCSRACQVAHHPLHRPFCGLPLPQASSFALSHNPFSPSSPFQPPPALLFHLAALTTLPPPPPSAAAGLPGNEPQPPSFLYFPSSPTPAEGSVGGSRDPPMPVPISLPEASRNLFNCLQFEACKSGNPLSVNLMFSLLLTETEALGGVEERLVEQLSEEYRLDGKQEVGGEKRRSLREMLQEDEQPSEEELYKAIGGDANAGMLFEWQVSESERLQSSN